MNQIKRFFLLDMTRVTKYSRTLKIQMLKLQASRHSDGRSPNFPRDSHAKFTKMIKEIKYENHARIIIIVVGFTHRQIADCE